MRCISKLELIFIISLFKLFIKKKVSKSIAIAWALVDNLSFVSFSKF